ncbi:hypothetical protein IOD16_20885 [Saccharothrix sp. 6-C]|uniref:Uncharacterized protein n=1 Tax=Saccharothrix texasensis TaxID=103734 RepID=A0A3N1HIV0_9PSEU|nr:MULTISPECIES: hypothetical protein [Saccharothrix]QQQ73720.1 hypothetical protein IOD16_20885 [Saccharothrix sp. 6-C]ROP42414.1 hypothetical protein EDD40_7914 [Saccharothrix texasensis]
MQRFTEDSGAYEHWLADNQDQYVVNAERSLNPDNLMLHRASCGTINGTPARGTTWVGSYVKLVGTRVELETEHPTARPCRLCL